MLCHLGMISAASRGMSVDNEKEEGEDEDFSNQAMVGVTNMKAVHKERQRGTLEFMHSVGSIFHL